MFFLSSLSLKLSPVLDLHFLMRTAALGYHLMTDLEIIVRTSTSDGALTLERLARHRLAENCSVLVKLSKAAS